MFGGEGELVQEADAVRIQPFKVNILSLRQFVPVDCPTREVIHLEFSDFY